MEFNSLSEDKMSRGYMNSNNNSGGRNLLFPELHYHSQSPLELESSQQSLHHQQQQQPYPLHHHQQTQPAQAVSGRQSQSHHPLQVLQWEQMDKQHSTWQLEKYNRLQDSRKQPQTVERGPNDRLVVQFKNEQNKMVSVCHNYHELESFCIHPLLFSHDLITKDTKLLFCVKDQIDGSIRYKFRVKFIAIEALLDFCSTVAGYVSIKSYEEWGRKNTSQLDLMNLSICSDHSTLSSQSHSFSGRMSTAGHLQPQQQQPQQQLMNATQSDAGSDIVVVESSIGSGGNHNGVGSGRAKQAKFLSPRAAIRSRSADDLLGRKNQEKMISQIQLREFTDKATQVSPRPRSPPSPSVAPKTAPSCGHSDNEIPCCVHVHIENLLSVEAVREFGRILSEVIVQSVGNNNNMNSRQPQENKQQEPTKTVTPEKLHSPAPAPPAEVVAAAPVLVAPVEKKKRGRKRRTKSMPDLDATADETLLDEQLQVEEQDDTILGGNSRKRSRKSGAKSPSSMSVWRAYDLDCQLKNLFKNDPNFAQPPRRRRSNSFYNLRGTSPEHSAEQHHLQQPEVSTSQQQNEATNEGERSIDMDDVFDDGIDKLDDTVPESDLDESREL